jgi:hypothetical protein
MEMKNMMLEMEEKAMLVIMYKNFTKLYLS